MTPAEFKVALGLKMRFPPEYPLILARSNWDHICRAQDGKINLNASLFDPKTAATVAAADSVTFVIWSQDRWVVQRPGTDPVALPKIMPSCKEVRQ